MKRMQSGKGRPNNEGQESLMNYFGFFFLCLVSVEVDGGGQEEEGGIIAYTADREVWAQSLLSLDMQAH